MNNVISSHIAADSPWTGSVLGQDMSNRSQAASSTEPGPAQSTDSNAVSRADSTASNVLPQREEMESSEPIDHSNVVANHALNTAGTLPGKDEPGKIHTDEVDPSNAWSQKTVLTFDGGGIRGYSSLLILQYLMHKISELEKPHAENSFHPLEPPSPSTKASVILPQHILIIPGEMEEDDLRRTSQYLPCHYFDYIAGTSTGGLNAIMLGRFGMPIVDCLRIYEKFGNEIFKNPRKRHIRRINHLWSVPLLSFKSKYDATQVENFFKQMVSKYEPSGLQNFPQKHSDMCRTIAVAMRHDISTDTYTPYLFRSYPHPSHSDDSHSSGLHCPQINDDNYPIWKVARATTAAPTYFRAVQMGEDDTGIEFIDGGFGVNCPSEQVYRSIQELGDDDPRPVKVLVSIGTGKPPPASRRKKAIVKFSGSNPRGLLRLASAALKQTTNAENIHERVEEQMKTNHVPYFRLNAEEDLSSIKLDAFRGENGRRTLSKVIDCTRNYLTTNEEVRNKTNELAELLVATRRKRAYQHEQPTADPKVTQEVLDTINTATDHVLNSMENRTERWQDRWEIFVCGVKYSCNIPKLCDWTRDRLESRQELREHYVVKHGFNARSTEIEAALNAARRYPIQESAARNKKEEGALASHRSTFASR